MSCLGIQQCEAALSPSPGNRYYSRGLAHEGCLSPPKEKIIAQADLKSACMELGICNPKSSTKRVLRIWDPPLTPDGLQIRQSKGPIEVEKPGGDRHPLTGRASPQMTPKTPRPSRGERLKPKTSRPLPKGREWGRGEKGQKTKESLQLTIYSVNE